MSPPGLVSASAAWLRYVRNSAYYAFFRRAPSVHELHRAHVAWVPAASRGQVVSSDELCSVWLIRECIDQEAALRIKALLEKQHEDLWHGYELGRRMLPLHADPPLEASEAAQLQLGTLDVFGRRPPQAWPRLQQMRDEGLAGAEELYCLQQVATDRLGWGRCLFVQAQQLEPGASVSAHRDALPFGGDRIATVVLQGSGVVRVGHQSFEVNAGDFYALADEARYFVEHEVQTAPSDRLSLTFRYGLSPHSALPSMEGEELRGDRGGGSALRDV
ncbi:unnamed protein product [Durusdinium trenchii]|uniref:Uncharacterized protein n=2 Tax=Durusdinium trenchii TaxID=1381693 RepID=A0ABP0IPH8_9DINO